MARRTALNPDGTGFQVGPHVRLERGLSRNSKGLIDKDSEAIWIVSKKVDVKDDPETSYDYRYDEVANFPETDPGQCPAKASERADALAAEA